MQELIINQNDIHESVWSWLFNGNNGISELSFLSADYDENNNIISDSRVVYTPVTMGKSTIIKKYVRGINRMQYDFILKQYAPISTQTNTAANLRVTEVFENLVEWVKEQWELDNKPELPEGCNLEKITVNPGAVAGADKNGAEFIITINLVYTKGV